MLIHAVGDDVRGIVVEVGRALVRIAADVTPALASAVARSLRR